MRGCEIAVTDSFALKAHVNQAFRCVCVCLCVYVCAVCFTPAVLELHLLLVGVLLGLDVSTVPNGGETEAGLQPFVRAFPTRSTCDGAHQSARTARAAVHGPSDILKL